MTRTEISAVTWGNLALLALIWGGSFLSVRVALDEIGVLSVVAHRVLWGALALWAVVLARRLPLPRDARVWGALLVMGLLNNAIPFTLLAWGQLHIATGLTGILNAATALWGVLVAAAVFADERLTPARLAGVLIGVAGVAVAIGPAELATFDPRSLAQLAVIGATVSYALAGSWARARLSGLSPLVSAAGMLTGGALILVPLAWAVEGPLPLDLRPVTWGAVAYVSLAATALAYLLYYRILAAAGAGTLMLVTLMIPPVAILLGAAVRGEALEPRAFSGFSLIALGLVVLDGRARHALTKYRRA